MLRIDIIVPLKLHHAQTCLCIMTSTESFQLLGSNLRHSIKAAAQRHVDAFKLASYIARQCPGQLLVFDEWIGKVPECTAPSNICNLAFQKGQEVKVQMGTVN